MFYDYKSLNEKFTKNYKPYIDKYPYALFALEKIFRMYLVGKSDLVKRDFELYSSFSFKRAVVRRILYFFSFFTASLSKKEKVVFDIHKFKYLSDKCEEDLNQAGFLCINNKIISAFLLSHVFRGNRKLTQRFRFFFESFSRGSINDKEIEELNIAVREELEYIANIFSLLNIKFLFVLGDSSAEQRIICEAAKYSGCKVFVFAHGYFQSPSLITVAPVYADKLFVWSEKQKKDISKAVEEECGEKIFYYGSFFKRNNSRSKKIKGKSVALLGIEVLPEKKAERDFYLSVIQDYISLLKCNGFAICIRPHPKEKKMSSLEFFSKKNCGEVFLSIKSNAMDDLLECDVFLSSNSSLLIEAHSMGVICFQIAELKRFYFEEINSVFLDNFQSEYNKAKLKLTDDNSCGVKFFNINEGLKI